jgi:uncharacterized protein YndB with AHSA1/START domain
MDTTDTIATLLEADGGWTLRFERTFDHPVDKVWRCLTEPAHRDAWFPQRIVGDLVPGGALQFVDDPNLPAEGMPGRCVTIEPPELLELEWGDDRLRIELTEHGDRTSMVFLDTIDDRRHAARTGSGWHLCLDGLRAQLDGTSVPATTEQSWDELHDRYLDAVGGERHVWGTTPT